MCIVVIKKSDNKKYAYFLAHNRDESYELRWKNIGFHWPERPDVYGPLDLTSKGTWLAMNNHVLAVIVNQESKREQSLPSRCRIVIDCVSGAKSALDSLGRLQTIGVVKPFNLIILDRKSLYIASNRPKPQGRVLFHYKELTDVLYLVNRSGENDFHEPRVRLNFEKFRNAEEPCPTKDKWLDWMGILTESSYCNHRREEYTMWLSAKTWGTLCSYIIAIPFALDEPFSVKEVKRRDYYEL